MIHTSTHRDPRPPRNPTKRRDRRDRERYQREQAQLDAEAVTRWQAIVADWPPLTTDQIRTIAEVLRRIDTRATPGTHPTRKDRDKRVSHPPR